MRKFLNTSGIVITALIISGCGGGGSGGSGDGNPSNSDTNITTDKGSSSGDKSSSNQNLIEGYVIDDPIIGAKIEIYDLSGKLIGKVDKSTDKSGHFQLNLPSEDKRYIIKSTGGTLKGKSFKADMFSICSLESDCYITPYSTLLYSIKDKFTGLLDEQIEEAKKAIKSRLGVGEFPFRNGDDRGMEVFRKAIGDDGSKLPTFVSNFSISSSTTKPAGDTTPPPQATNTPPVANAGLDMVVKDGKNITLDGSQSRDKEDSIDSLKFVWREGSVVLGEGKSLTLGSLPVGTHTITLVVTDTKGASSSDEVIVDVEEIVHYLKKTGQTKSYDKDGNEVTNGSLKDDGYYQKGVDSNYTRDDTKEIVTDNITGLMWQDDANASTVKKQWLSDENYDKCTGENGQTQDDTKCFDTSGDTATTYCTNLTLGGYNDWRLPTRKELKSIVDYGRYDPAIDPIFNHTSTSATCWSSTTVAHNHDYAWVVNFWVGYDFGFNKDDSVFVRCVREDK